MKNNPTIIKYNCHFCKSDVEIQAVMETKRILKICTDCLLKYNKEQSEEYIPFVEE